MKEGLTRADDHGRHGGDVAGIREHLDYLNNLGFTAIWLNPILKTTNLDGLTTAMPPRIITGVDRRFGSNEEYKELVEAARAKGMKVIMDMIMNHCGSEHCGWRSCPQRIGSTTAVSMHRRPIAGRRYGPYAAESDVAGFSDGWFVEEMPGLNQRQPLLADYLIQTRCGGLNTWD